MLVHQILNHKGGENIVSIDTGSRVMDAARILSEKKIGAVIVLDGDEPVGILSERDIVGEIGRRGDACLKDAVDDLMTRKLVTCTADDTADEVLTKMSEGRFRHMPVMKEGKMGGLISIRDVVEARLSELSMENHALTEMISGR